MLGIDDINRLVLTGTDAVDAIVGWSGENLTYTGLAGDDSIQASTGNDTLYGGTGADQISGSSGNDTYYVDNLGDIVTELSGQGGDTIYSSISYDVANPLPANVENLVMTGTYTWAPDGTYIRPRGYGNELDNRITGTTLYDDVIDGGAGNDLIIGSGGSDTLTGGAGADTYRYTVTSTSGLSGNQKLIAGTGDRIELVGMDPDLVRLERGAWSHYWDDSPENQDVWYVGGTSLGMRYNAPFSDLLIGVDNAFTINGGDNLGLSGIDFDTNSDGIFETHWSMTDVVARMMTSTTGNDRLYGFGSSDVIEGGTGDDYIMGGGGDDVLLGGDGNDVIKVREYYTVAGSYLSSYLFGEAGNDNLTGGEYTDNLYGGDGNDQLNAYNSGTEGDLLYGEGGNDTLLGSYGSDWLDGGTGDDIITDYAGDDVYVFNAGYGNDHITNFGADTGGDVVTGNIEPLQMIFARSNYDLTMHLAGSTDNLTIKNWYSADQYKMDAFLANTGDVLMQNEVDQLIQAMATFSANNGGISWEDAVAQRPQDVEAVLAAYWQPAA